MMNDRIIKALSGFYYVQAEDGVVECRARGKFRKEGVSPLVGDLVRIERSGKSGTVTEILPRKNSFIRPAVANVDLLVLLASCAIPQTEPFLIDRVLAIAGQQGVEPLICVNKNDLEPGEGLAGIYRRAGFRVVVTSAETGEGIDELRAAMQQYPEAEVMENYTRSDMLNVVGQFALESFIDWETGTCSFDQGFADVLEFCNLFPEDYPDYEGGYVYVDPLLKMSRGELLLNPTYLYGFDGYYRAGDTIVDGGTTFVGIPGVGGSGGAFNCNTGIAMSTTCKDKDGAWQFMRRYIAGGFSDYVSGFSTNAKEFDQALEEAMTPVYTTDENGNQVATPIPVEGSNIKRNMFEQKVRAFVDACLGDHVAPIPTSQIIYNQAIIDGIIRSSACGHEVEINL